MWKKEADEENNPTTMPVQLECLPVTAVCDFLTLLDSHEGDFCLVLMNVIEFIRIFNPIGLDIQNICQEGRGVTFTSSFIAGGPVRFELRSEL